MSLPITPQPLKTHAIVKMTVDKMTVDKMTVDKMTVDKMTVDKMTRQLSRQSQVTLTEGEYSVQLTSSLR